MRGEEKRGFRGCRDLSKAVSTPPGSAQTTPEKRGGFPRLPATLKSRLNAPRPPKRLRRSEKAIPGCRKLSKAALTSPWAAETTPEKGGGFPRLPAILKSRLDAPRGRRNDSGEARRVSAVAGNSQKPPLRPPEPPKQLRRNEEGFRGSRHLSKAVSTTPGAAETTPEKRGGFPR